MTTHPPGRHEHGAEGIEPGAPCEEGSRGTQAVADLMSYPADLLAAALLTKLQQLGETLRHVLHHATRPK